MCAKTKTRFICTVAAAALTDTKRKQLMGAYLQTVFTLFSSLKWMLTRSPTKSPIQSFQLKRKCSFRRCKQINKKNRVSDENQHMSPETELMAGGLGEWANEKKKEKKRIKCRPTSCCYGQLWIWCSWISLSGPKINERHSSIVVIGMVSFSWISLLVEPYFKISKNHRFSIICTYTSHVMYSIPLINLKPKTITYNYTKLNTPNALIFHPIPKYMSYTSNE